MPDFLVLNPAEGKASAVTADALILNGDKSSVRDVKDFRRSPFYRVLAEAARLHEAKNRGYADDADPFKNFRAAIDVGSDPFSGIIIRMSDKWARLCSLRRNPDNDKVNEPLRDTLLDLGIYALIAVAVLDEQVAVKAGEAAVMALRKPEKTLEPGKCFDCGGDTPGKVMCESCFQPIADELDAAFGKKLGRKHDVSPGKVCIEETCPQFGTVHAVPTHKPKTDKMKPEG